MRDFIVGTAGHIDHGKTTLLKALTGIDADRLEEEKRRGITIDIGFAHMALASYRIGFIDVPGHEKFVKNMLAGIGGIDLLLLVVAADESIMPQTIEHFNICQLLKIPRGIIAVTKKRSVEEEMLDLVQEELRKITSGTFMQDSPIIPVDSISGEGLVLLQQALLKQILELNKNPKFEKGKLLRLPIDRIFSMKGFGTVITGTLASGKITREDTIVVYPNQNEGKIRRIEIFNQETATAIAGQRTALNVSGLDKQDLERGMVLSHPGVLCPSHILDATVQVLDNAPIPLKQRAPIRFHHGSGEWLGRVYPLESKMVLPGQSGLVQIRLEQPAMCWVGDRFILRMYSPMITIGGGVVLDNYPRKHRTRNLHQELPPLQHLKLCIEKQPLERDQTWLRFLVHSKGESGMDMKELTERTGSLENKIRPLLDNIPEIELVPQKPILAVTREALQNMEKFILDYLEHFHTTHPLASGVSREELRGQFLKNSNNDYFQFLIHRLEKQQLIRIDTSTITREGRQPELNKEQQVIRLAILEKIQISFPEPPTLQELKIKLSYDSSKIEDIYYFLLQQGELIRISGRFVLTNAQIDQLKKELRKKFLPGETFAVPQVKETLNITRKYAIPFLEYLDQERVTRREGAMRVLL